MANDLNTRRVEMLSFFVEEKVFYDIEFDEENYRNCASDHADVLLTSDDDILKHRQRLAELKLTVIRPSEWLNTFLEDIRCGENAVDWLEKTLFGMEKYHESAPNTACTRRVGVAAFSGRLHGLRLIPSKWRSLLPPTRG